MTRHFRCVILETPYAGDIQTNVEYARACMHDCIMRGDAPFASHLLYTQDGVLDDAVKDQRELGMAAGFAWIQQSVATLVYTDRGISPGMERGIAEAKRLGRPVAYRRLYPVTP